MNSQDVRFASVRRASVVDQVTDALQAKIAANFKPGDPLPGMRELCRQFNVSINTVQTAIATLAREGIVRKRPGSGVFATGLRSQRRIGILSELNLVDQRISRYYLTLAGAIKAKLEQAGFAPCLYLGTEPGGDYQSQDSTCPWFWADAAAGRLSGAVVLTSKSTSAWDKRLRQCPIPIVGDKTEFDVRLDTDGITKTAVRQLAERGCRRLGLMSWHAVEPFLHAVKACGLTTRDTWIRSDLNPSLRGAGWDEFHEIWASPGDKPDGLVILDDMLFLDAHLAMTEMGVRVPRDLQLAVQTTANAFPPVRLPITAVEIDPAESATVLVDLLEQRLRGEQVPPVQRLLSYSVVAPATARSDRIERDIESTIPVEH